MQALPTNIMDAIKYLAKVTQDSPLCWLVGGSAAMLLHGVESPAPPNDLDIDTNLDGVFELERLLAEFLSEPVCESDTPLYHDYIGRFNIQGVVVDLVAEMDMKHPDFVYQFRITPKLYQTATRVKLDGVEVALTPLEHLLLMNLIRGRHDKVELIAGFLRTHGPDWRFLDSIMASSSAPEEFTNHVKAILRG